ncbi:MAG: class I SAM-dependent methyltransferase [Armatimonadetes bacterium]|nr:class I SAM-dependent methyltransferase [Armatimonadota bacterium]
MDIENYEEINRAAWNEVAPIHRAAWKSDLFEEVKSASFNVLGEVERNILAGIGVEGKRVAHFCCNNGRELISAMKMGAASGVGFDISDEFVLTARGLAEAARVDCRFVRTSVLDIAGEWEDTADIALFTVGGLCWIQDLKRLFAMVAGILADEGHLFIYDTHPFTDMFAMPGEAEYDPGSPMKIVCSYFSGKPWIDSSGLDYIGGTTYEARPAVSFPHRISELLAAIIEAGFTLRRFQEYPHDLSSGFGHLANERLLPLSYSLVAQKTGQGVRFSE